MKIILFLLLFAVLSPFLPFSQPQLQAQMLFEHTSRTYLSRNVVYELNRQVTTAGFLDVHILRIPLNDPYISIAPVESIREIGLRETTQNLLATAGAIAGVNADFFGLTGTHTASMGPVVANGQLVSMTQSHNQNVNEFASFILDNNNIPFLRYIQPRIFLSINGMELMRINSINRVPNLDFPVIINRAGMANTAQLVARFPDMWQILVVDGIVTSFHPAEVLVVPENGFIIAMNVQTLVAHNPFFWGGMTAEYTVFSNFERPFSEIQAAVGGGGLILNNGQIVHDTGTVIGGRQPRTALGISGDRQSLVLMVVDGRGRSIGATHEEIAMLMLRNGVFDAMHFDGGGSSTMVAQTYGRNTGLQVVNTVSEGAQRAVINALGVFDNSTPGAIAELVLLPENTNVPPGTPLMLNVLARDLYRHNIPINLAEVQFYAEVISPDGSRHTATGEWFATNIYIPNQPGSLYVTATLGDLSVSKLYFVQAIADPTGFENDPIRTEMTTAIPGFAHDFELFVPRTGTFGYSARLETTALVIQMSAAGGGIFAADRNQWGMFNNLILSTVPSAVIIHMDTNPLRMNSAEFDLFHSALRTHIEQNPNLTIFVVSNREEVPFFYFRNGIRYLDLGINADVTMNFRVVDGQIWYDF
ncbi:MAG: phosphodiester glycosidase family protein [Defluviitaleaceae bacterium]|nr:phosphodiester glycosidase family protein [Defluviitaleaceae bacterium]